MHNNRVIDVGDYDTAMNDRNKKMLRDRLTPEEWEAYIVKVAKQKEEVLNRYNKERKELLKREEKEALKRKIEEERKANKKWWQLWR